MKYVALLRGINVGGNTIIKMEVLKAAIENAGFTNVHTFIQSGNVIFESEENDTALIENILEKCLDQTFHLTVPVVVYSSDQFHDVIMHVPKNWVGDDLRCYIAFIKHPITPAEVASAAKLNPEVDSLAIGPGVVYMSTKLSGITKSGFSKLAMNKKIYRALTIRNYTTVKKLSDLIANA